MIIRLPGTLQKHYMQIIQPAIQSLMDPYLIFQGKSASQIKKKIQFFIQ